jgi:glycosyltransferase involved in cell wall biosynthesis
VTTFFEHETTGPAAAWGETPALADVHNEHSPKHRMIENRTILCFASGYDAPPTSKHHVMHILAERNTVVWVNYHASRAPSASASDLRHMLRKLGQVAAGPTCPRPNLHVLTPLVVPLPGSAAARRLNRTLLVWQVRRLLRRVQAGPVQLWSFTPDVSYVLGRFGEEKVLYYCVDDHASFTGYDAAQVLRDEEDLCRRADLVVTTSMALHEARRPWNPNTILVPHGVDYEHFSQALGDLPEPADLAGIPRPRLGFFGLLRDWVDLGLLAEVARRRPDWHIVLLGDSAVDLAPYRGLPNMHFLGRKPYAELPAYCRAFDVGLIPFKLNDLTRAVNPIKLREYLAAGLPVVSTPLPEVKRYQRLVNLAEGPDAFLRGVASSLNGQADSASRAARARAMAGEAWGEKVDMLCRQLLADLPQTQRPRPGDKECTAS